MWDTVEQTSRHLSHEMPCTECGHAPHTFLPCSETCDCNPRPVPGSVSGRKVVLPRACLLPAESGRLPGHDLLRLAHHRRLPQRLPALRVVEGPAGYQDVDGDPNEPGHEECITLDPVSDHRILFIEVPEAEEAKNRVHFDLVPRPGPGTRRPSGLAAGATIVNDLRGNWGRGTGWAVLADPEGNEFCVLRTPDEKAATSAPIRLRIT